MIIVWFFTNMGFISYKSVFVLFVCLKYGNRGYRYENESCRANFIQINNLKKTVNLNPGSGLLS